MSSFNLMKAEDRAQKRADLLQQISAIRGGTWPRSLNDQLRWSTPTHKVQGRMWTEKEWTLHMCEVEIRYLDDLERRLSQGDPGLKGWDGWLA